MAVAEVVEVVVVVVVEQQIFGRLVLADKEKACHIKMTAERIFEIRLAWENVDVLDLSGRSTGATGLFSFQF